MQSCNASMSKYFELHKKVTIKNIRSYNKMYDLINHTYSKSDHFICSCNSNEIAFEVVVGYRPREYPREFRRQGITFFNLETSSNISPKCRKCTIYRNAMNIIQGDIQSAVERRLSGKI